MDCLTDAEAAHIGGIPVADFGGSLSTDSNIDYEVMAAIRAIPPHARQGLLTELQALICADATHTVKALFSA